MKYIAKAALLLAILQVCSVAQMYITGEQSGDLTAGEYIVTGSIYIIKGQTLRIKAGAKLYFEQYSGITVLGTLVCDGTIDSPVIMTSIRERQGEMGSGRPEPFDWNGIEVTADARYVEIRNTRIRHSVYGIKVKSTATNVKLERVEFYNNGYASLIREDKFVQVQQNIPFSINWNAGSDSDQGERIVVMREEKQIDKRKQKDSSDIKKTDKNKKSGLLLPLRITTAAVAVGGATIFFIENSNYGNYSSKYSRQTSPQGAAYYRSKMNSADTWRWIGASLAIAGVAGFALTFVF